MKRTLYDTGRTRELRSLRWSHPPTPGQKKKKIEKNKFVLKGILGHLQYFEPMFFLVENSTYFFLKPSLKIDCIAYFLLKIFLSLAKIQYCEA